MTLLKWVNFSGEMSQTITFGDSCAPITVYAWNKDRTRKFIQIHTVYSLLHWSVYNYIQFIRQYIRQSYHQLSCESGK